MADLASDALSKQPERVRPISHSTPNATRPSRFRLTNIQPRPPAIAVSVALGKPGETVDDFQTRINRRAEWGETRYGRDRVELVLTRESMERRVELIGRF